MASADLRDELTCSICLTIDRCLTLKCGHHFCKDCTGDAMDTEGETTYPCIKCRKVCRVECNTERLLSWNKIYKSSTFLHPEQKEAETPCTYCIQSPVPAAKTCLQCEASLCEDHLRVHSKSAEHVLTEPTSSLEDWRCSVHREILRYYCYDDEACICVSCSLAGEHRGHQVENLNEAFEKTKEKLRGILERLNSQRKKEEKKVQSLEELMRKVQEKATRVTERVTALIRDIREQLEALEKQVLSLISRQEEQVSLRVSDLIRQLEIKKKELSRKMVNIEALCDMTDPVTFLQEWVSDRVDYCNIERHDKNVHKVGGLDMGLICVTLHSGLAGILTKITRRVPEASDMLLNVNTSSGMLLDVNTASNDVSVSEDLKTVSWTGMKQSHSKTVKRFQGYEQVLSSSSFSSGRHYWEVEVSETGGWAVGVTYPSIHRRGERSEIGKNKKSWGLWRKRKHTNQYSVRHDSNIILLLHPSSCQRLGIFLNYEAGRLSFYELCDPIRHLHTFTAAFTEPLHAVFGVYTVDSWVRI